MEQDYLAEAKEYFKNDRFAQEATGIVIDEAAPGHAVCSFVITPGHLNAGGMVMGGAIFTLADFAFGVVANVSRGGVVTLNAGISYLNQAKGAMLIAEGTATKMGRSTCVVEVRVRDELGTLVAIGTFTGFRKS